LATLADLAEICDGVSVNSVAMVAANCDGLPKPCKANPAL
jgi:hypothetical protein